ncbi:MAG TPA: ATP-dependent protease LonB [Feifaniaceae bacterium]|nr:ATP-dependent protease LonB [Feifaniaceae bacterium]
MDWVTYIIIQIVTIGGIALFVYLRNKRRQQPQVTMIKPKQNVQELQRLARMRAKRLNVPLSEMTRPARFEDIVGQEEGIRALKAALCGPNPQHVLLYGPPGVGKTCAARLVLEEAKKRPDSPFNAESAFVELDATCVRFDERAIADPLIGSVHDPIYQGAGTLGAQGVPQPKPGAVTRAHCGILFLDEIGELHPMQMNKLLKVLEDRYVRFDSAYYSPDNASIPQHIHDIFQHGLPADFRLVGATTRRPEELPPALRSRCLELFFKPLGQKELEQVAAGAAERAGYAMEFEAVRCAALYAQSGRDAVNIVQLSCGLAHDEGRAAVLREDVEWVARTCNYAPRMECHMPKEPRVGTSNALAVAGAGQGMVLEIECAVSPASGGRGSLTLNGIVEEEELNFRDRRLKRKSTARGSVENVVSALSRFADMDQARFDIQFNIPGGIPVDGPSAGVALFIALMSAYTGKAASHTLASTGEVTISGEIRPVGGVREKIMAAEAAGAARVLIPLSNWEDSFAEFQVEVVTAETVREAVSYAFPDSGSRPQIAREGTRAVNKEQIAAAGRPSNAEHATASVQELL